jgi:hypothetical protein
MQIVLNDLDPTKDEKLLAFFEGQESALVKMASILTYNTDADFEGLFEKIAETYEPSSFKELQEKVEELFPENVKLANKLTTWGDKLCLDRDRLKKVFNL